MVKRGLQYLIVTLLTGISMAGQEADYGFGYQTIMKDNPSMTGIEGDAVLRISYMNHYPGRNFNLQSFYLSYDSFIEALHGGLGAYVSNDYLGGILNDLRGGFTYSYHLQADRNIFINAGLGASFYHRGLNLNNIILPDQIDPLGGIILTSAESVDVHGHTVFDVSTGITVFAGRYFGAFSISHLAQPDLSGTGSDTERLRRRYMFNMSGSFGFGKEKELVLTPVITGEMQGGMLTAGAGTSFSAGLISLNTLMITGTGGNINLRSGLSLMKGSTGFFYNYTYNIASKNYRIPFSLMHQVGMAISLYNVDKRKTIKTIKFPNL